MIRRFVLAGLVAVAALAVDAPRFEIADIHPSPTSEQPFMRGGFYRGGRYEIRSASMVDLIRTAYRVDSDKVTGGPAWLETDRFDVIAKAPADATAETLKLMLQALLAERFSLVVHNDTQPLPAYALRVGKKVQMKAGDGPGETGCKLQSQPDPPPGSGNFAIINMNGVTLRLGSGSFVIYSCRNSGMASFADELPNMLLARAYLTTNRVVDKTGLQGAWSFDFKYSPMLVAGGDNADLVTLFDAVDKQLGLKLEATKIPMPVIAVDSVNEKPTENAPGVTEKVPVAPTEFDVADIKPSEPLPAGEGRGMGANPFQPGVRINLRYRAMSDLIGLAWNLNGNTNGRIVGLPKSLETSRWDIVAKAPTSAPLNAPLNAPANGAPPLQNLDFDTMRVMLQALLKDRFGLVVHTEERPLPGYALVAVKPKLKPADPANRPGCKEGPGADGKDARTTNPTAGRLVTCLNMTMADFAAQIPQNAGGYFGQFPGGVVDATKLEGKYDITLNFSGAGMAMSGVGGGGDAGSSGAGQGAGQVADPTGVITLQDAIEKQLGLKPQPQKNPASVLVVDHVEEKPGDN